MTIGVEKKRGFIYRLEYTNLVGVFVGGAAQINNLLFNNDSYFVMTKLLIRANNSNDVGVFPTTLSSQQLPLTVNVKDNQSGEYIGSDTNNLLQNNIMAGLLCGGGGFHPFRQTVPQVLFDPIRFDPNSSLTVTMALLATFSVPKLTIDFIGTKHYINARG